MFPTVTTQLTTRFDIILSPAPRYDSFISELAFEEMMVGDVAPEQPSPKPEPPSAADGPSDVKLFQPHFPN